MNTNLRESAVASALVERAIDRRDQQAIVTPQRSVTFDELASRTANLATTILDSDDSSTWLPVFVDRSIDSVVAVLAVIHAGRPFVPIDAELPSARIDHLMARIGEPKTAVVATTEMSGILPSGTEAVPLGIDHSTHVAPVSVDPTAPGAIYFTSGSTGSAKGVVRTWSSINRRLGAVVPPGETVRGSHLQPLNFSGGMSKTVRVAAGETVCMIDPRSVSLDELVAWLAQVEITSARLGGGHVDALLRRPDLTRWLPSVREFSVFGSQRDWSQVPLIRQLCSPDVSIVNSYSATEVGNVSQFVVTANTDVSTGKIPSGTLPIDRLKLVADDDSQEIWVRDPDAIEYLGDPELNSRKFVIDDEGVRWWRSGDLGRIDDNGLFYFLGRLDLMVKINGMRVEPEEAEHALRSIRGISSAAVVAHPTSNGSYRLVGHVCVDDDSLTPTDVRSRLNELLPSHLVPAFFVRHESLPYTDRQKLDRQALLSMPTNRWSTPVPYRKHPHQTLWLTSKIEQIIGLGKIYPSEDIWEAGLDSMGAVELCSAIADLGHGQIDPRVLLTARTAEDLVRTLELGRQNSMSHVVEFNPSDSRLPVFAVPGTTGTAFAFRPLAEALGAEQPVVVIEPRGMHSREKIERTVAERVESIVEAVNRRLGSGQPCLIVSHSGGATYTFEAARTLQEMGRRVHLVFLDGLPRDRSTLNITPEFIKKISSGRKDRLTALKRLRWFASVLRQVPGKVWNVVMMPIFLKYPGKRRYTIDHYKYFWWIERLALRQYSLRPLDVPATLLHVGNGDLPQTASKLVSDLDCHVVTGNHTSMLFPPHVTDIAHHVERLLEQLLKTSPNSTRLA